MGAGGAGPGRRRGRPCVCPFHRRAALTSAPRTAADGMAAPTFNPAFDSIGKAFVAHYYRAFDGGTESRKALAPLYLPQSVMTFESKQMQGATAILTYLTATEGGLTFNKVAHKGTTLDCHPTYNGRTPRAPRTVCAPRTERRAAAGGVLVTVMGVAQPALRARF